MEIEFEPWRESESLRTWLMTQGSYLRQDVVDEQSVRPHQQEAPVSRLSQSESTSATAGSEQREVRKQYTKSKRMY